ncbi:hypothetical protein ACOSP7_016816 [Xanthoceras sorbifolium]
MANEGTQGKSKAIWDPRTHEIWVDLAIEQGVLQQASNIECNVDETNSLDYEEANHEKEVECSNHKDKILEPNRKKFKKGKRNNSRTSKLSNQHEEPCESIKSRSSYIQTDPPGCNVQEVVDRLATLPECEPMNPLFKLGISLFAKIANREIFVALRVLEYQIQWLKD